MHEVIVENKQGKKKVVFFSSDLKYYIVGRVFTSDANKDITFLEAHKQGVLPPPKGIKVDPKSINLKNAVLFKEKEGARDAILFADPLDPVSRKEVLELRSLGFNVYVKLVPVYGPPSVKAFVYLLGLKKEKPEKVIEALTFSPEKIQEIVDKSNKKYAAQAKEVDANQKEASLLGIKGVLCFCH
jgi:hypothetical protein